MPYVDPDYDQKRRPWAIIAVIFVIIFVLGVIYYG